MSDEIILKSQDGNCVDTASFLEIPSWYKYLNCDPDGSPRIDHIMDIWRVVTGIIDILLYIGGAAAVIVLVYGGIRMIMSQGQPDKIAQARQTLIYAAAGLSISIIARTVVTFIAGAF